MSRTHLLLWLVWVAAACSWRAPNPPPPTTSTKAPSQLEEKIAEYMDARARVTGFNGVVLVARGGQVVFRRAFGAANYEIAVPLSPETKFRIGSVSKQFT